MLQMMSYFRICFFTLILFLSACQRGAISQIAGGEEDTVTITFNLRTGSLSTRGYDIDPSALADLNIYSFTEDGRLFSHVFSNDTEYALQVLAGKSFRFYVVANAGKTLPVLSQTLLEDLVFVTDTPEDMARNRTLLMSGKTGLIPVTGNQSISVMLIRCTARLHIFVNTENLAPDINLLFNRITINNVPGSIRLFGPSSLQDTSSFFIQGETMSGNELEPLTTEGIFLHTYENIQGTLLPGNENPTAKIPDPLSPAARCCTFIEMEGMYESPEYRGPIKYRLYPGTDNTTNFDLFRNTLYKITVNFYGSGINEMSWRIDTSALDSRPLELCLQPAWYRFNTYGQTCRITPVFQPATTHPDFRRLLWTSSNPGVASVDSTGEVTSVHNGNCYILAVSEDNPQVRDSMVIEVEKASPLVSLTVSSDTLYAGCESYMFAQAAVVTEPGGSVVWESSDWNVLGFAGSDQSATLVAINPGTAVLTAYHKDDPSVRDSVTVQILKPTINLSGSSELYMYITFSPKTITASVTNAPPGATLEFTSQNSYIATVSGSGVVTARHEGCTHIEVHTQGAERKRVNVFIRQNLSSSNLFFLVEMNTGETVCADNIITSGDCNYILVSENGSSTDLSFYPNADPYVWFDIDNRPGGFIYLNATGKKAGHSLVARNTQEDPEADYIYLTVKDSTAPLSLTDTAISLTAGTCTEPRYESSPALTRQDIVWMVSDSRIASVDTNGKVTAHTCGQAVLMATGNGVTATSLICVTP